MVKFNVSVLQLVGFVAIARFLIEIYLFGTVVEELITTLLIKLLSKYPKVSVSVVTVLLCT